MHGGWIRIAQHLQHQRCLLFRRKTGLQSTGEHAYKQPVRSLESHGKVDWSPIYLVMTVTYLFIDQKRHRLSILSVCKYHLALA